MPDIILTTIHKYLKEHGYTTTVNQYEITIATPIRFNSTVYTKILAVDTTLYIFTHTKTVYNIHSRKDTNIDLQTPESLDQLLELMHNNHYSRYTSKYPI